MKKLGLIIALLVLGASSAWAFGGHCGGMPGGPGCMMNPCFACNMNLTEDQKAQFQPKHEAFMAEMQPLRDEFFNKKMELRQLWAKPNPSKAEISVKQQEIRAIQAQMQEKSTEFQLECRQMLTPEQLEKMTATQAPCGGRGGGHGCGMGRW